MKSKANELISMSGLSVVCMSESFELLNFQHLIVSKYNPIT
jgi:hypothetical protein